jgi:hypothetical protein
LFRFLAEVARELECCFAVIDRVVQARKLLAAEFHAELSQLFANFVKAGHTKVLAFQQIVAGLSQQFTDGGQTETRHALACPN